MMEKEKKEDEWRWRCSYRQPRPVQVECRWRHPSLSLQCWEGKGKIWLRKRTMAPRWVINHGVLPPSVSRSLSLFSNSYNLSSLHSHASTNFMVQILFLHNLFSVFGVCIQTGIINFRFQQTMKKKENNVTFNKVVFRTKLLQNLKMQVNFVVDRKLQLKFL